MSAIAVDIDGVLANFVKAFSSLCHKLDRELRVIEDPNIHTWDCHAWWGLSLKNSATIERAWQHIKTRNNKGFWYSPEPLNGFAKLIELHRKLPVVFMTRRDGGNVWADTVAWLRNNGINEPLLYRVHPGEEKHELCAKLGISVIIDDSPKVVEQCLKAGMKVIMPGYDYNKHVRPHPLLYRVFSLDAALSVAEIQSEYRAKSPWPDMFMEKGKERLYPTVEEERKLKEDAERYGLVQDSLIVKPDRSPDSQYCPSPAAAEFVQQKREDKRNRNVEDK